jgi:hypothetical protein
MTVRQHCAGHVLAHIFQELFPQVVHLVKVVHQLLHCFEEHAYALLTLNLVLFLLGGLLLSVLYPYVPGQTIPAAKRLAAVGVHTCVRCGQGMGEFMAAKVTRRPKPALTGVTAVRFLGMCSLVRRQA